MVVAAQYDRFDQCAVVTVSFRHILVSRFSFLSC
jgi:hypothetical protein